MASLKAYFVQGVLSSAAGISLIGNLGAPVSVNVGGDAVVVQYKFVCVDAPPGSALTAGTMQDYSATPTVNFTPDQRGGYCIDIFGKDAAGKVYKDRRVFQVREASGRLIPPYLAPDVALNFDGNLRGWAKYMEEWLHYVDSIVSGGGGGGSFTAGGDLGGTPTNQVVVGIQGRAVNPGLPVTSYYLGWDGTQWIGSLPFAPGGDLAATTPGSVTSQKVVSIQGMLITIGTPSNGQVLTYSSGSNSIVFLNAASGSFSAGGDLSGTPTSQNVIRIQNNAVQNIVPSDLQVLTWIAANTRWEPRTPSGGTSITWATDLAGSTNSSQIVVSLTGTGGVVTGPSSAIAIGASTATTGTGIRVPQGAGMTGRGGASNYNMISITATDTVAVGDSLASILELRAAAAGNIHASLGGTEYLRLLANGLHLMQNSASYWAKNSVGGDVQVASVSTSTLVLGNATTSGTVQVAGQSGVALTIAGTLYAQLGTTSLQLNNVDVIFAGTGSRRLLYAQQSIDAVASRLTISSQSAFSGASVNVSGGVLLLTSGAATPGSSGQDGSIGFSLGSSTNQPPIQIVDLATRASGTTRRVVALNQMGTLTTANVPVGSNADGVIFIAQATSSPNSIGNNPVGGGLLYVDADGGLKFHGRSGTVTPIANA